MITAQMPLAKAEVYSAPAWKPCLRQRLFSKTSEGERADHYYACVLPINRTVFFRTGTTKPWKAAARVCHLCALELTGDKESGVDHAILLGA